MKFFTTKRDSARHRATQRDTARHRATPRDTARHRATQRDTVRIDLIFGRVVTRDKNFIVRVNGP
jgi:hypothetical protein